MEDLEAIFLSRGRYPKKKSNEGRRRKKEEEGRRKKNEEGRRRK